jgi:N-formylglutamate deformylase
MEKDEVRHATGTADPVLDSLIAAPYALLRPEQQSAPFVFASPHSGRAYPQRFLTQSRLAPLDLRKSEDAFVDELFEAVPQLGAPLLAANFPRAFVDVNRSPGEIDPALFGPGSFGHTTQGFARGPDGAARSARVAVGLGVIPRIVRDGLEIYGGKLDAREAEFRLTAFYKPYHTMLCELVAETLERFGVAVIVDCHSMPSPPKRSDIVLGDRYGDSASTDLAAAAQRALASVGFDVARNAPYAGGYTTTLYGRPKEGIHALQIEINRDLYMNEALMEKTGSFDSVRDKLRTFAARLLEQGSAALPRRAPLRAAE